MVVTFRTRAFSSSQHLPRIPVTFSPTSLYLYHITTSLIGPVKDWPTVAITAYHYLAAVWSTKKAQDDGVASNHVYMRGGEAPEIIVSADDLRDRVTGQRIERMWYTANSGGLRMTVDRPNEDVEESPSE